MVASVSINVPTALRKVPARVTLTALMLPPWFRRTSAPAPMVPPLQLKGAPISSGALPVIAPPCNSKAPAWMVRVPPAPACTSMVPLLKKVPPTTVRLALPPLLLDVSVRVVLLVKLPFRVRLASPLSASTAISPLLIRPPLLPSTVLPVTRMMALLARITLPLPPTSAAAKSIVPPFK